MESDPVDQPLPHIRINEADRDRAVAQVQTAMVEGHLEFENIDSRFAAIYRADTRADLEAVTDDLPLVTSSVPVVRQAVPTTTFSLIGDKTLGGWIEIAPSNRVISIIGDVTVDLSSASFPSDGTVVEVWALVGDVKVIVPDGARVTTQVFSVIGDSDDRLVRPDPLGPAVTIRVRSLFGDTKVLSLSQVPEGLRGFWRRLRGAS